MGSDTNFQAVRLGRLAVRDWNEHCTKCFLAARNHFVQLLLTFQAFQAEEQLCDSEEAPRY